jgi:oligosaccharyl transferase (archaeosortase A-associated)
MTLKHVKSWDWGIISKPFLYSLLAGIFLGIYFLTWMGALLFVFIIFIYFVIQFIIDHLKSRPTNYLCFVSTITFIVALLIYLPASPDRMSLAAFFIAIVVPVMLAVLSHFMTNRGLKPVLYLPVILGLGLASLAILYIISPDLLRGMIGHVGILWASPIGTTVYEMEPLLFPGGDFSLAVAWGNFTTSFFLCFVSLGILIYLVIKRNDNDKMLLIIWSLVMLVATLSMRRFAYYFVVNVALLAGYLSWLILESSGFREKAAKPAEALIEAKRKEERQKKRQRDSSWSRANSVKMALGMIVVVFLVFYPNIGPLPGGVKPPISAAKYAPFAPSDAWCESLSWMRTNTPEPFGDPDFYYARYEPPPRGESYDYPQTAYGVTAWWDYGYWITRIGHRMPTSNPGIGHKGEASFFTAQDEASADRILLNKRMDPKYVIVDHTIATLVGGKFNTVATSSRSSPGKFFDIYYQPRDDKLEPVILFHPEYYRSLVIRLYNFDGSQVVPESSNVISYQERVTRDGQPYKEITSAKAFPSYEEAEAYISSQKPANYRIVSPDPLASPVPVPALEHYKLVYSSDGSKMMPSGKLVPEVKIFEYIK